MTENDFTSRLSAARSRTDWVRQQLLESYRNYLRLVANISADRNLRARMGDSDLVQETLIQAHRDFDQFRGVTERELLGWMRQIMSTKKALLARQHYGTAARDPRFERRLYDEIDQSSLQIDRSLVANGTSPAQHAEKRELAVILADALANLPEHYRDVVVLHHVQGNSLPQVAEQLGRSVDSVKKIWARAIVQLRSHMKGLGDA